MTSLSIPIGIASTLRQTSHLAIFTGAGISAESGIPTFRDASVGLWNNFDPSEVATAAAFVRQPELVWGWHEWLRSKVQQAEPNPGHHAIARLEKLIPRLTLITQNVDDLHERAGSTAAIHVHGSLFEAFCSSCNKLHPHPGSPLQGVSAMSIPPPKCRFCGGNVRHGVVMFDESLSSEVWGLAKQAIRDCDALLCIGTSLTILPAGILPFEAVERKKPVIQINMHPTELDDVASLTLRGSAGDLLPRLLREVWER